MVDYCFLYIVQSPLCLLRLPDLPLTPFPAPMRVLYPLLYRVSVSSHAVLVSLCELLLIWKYFQLFPHVTFRCLFPFVELGILLLVYLFGLECARFWGGSTDALLSFECGRVAENGCVDGSGGEGRGILLGRNPWQWGPQSPSASWVDELNKDLSETVATHWKRNVFCAYNWRQIGKWNSAGEKTLPFTFTKIFWSRLR